MYDWLDGGATKAGGPANCGSRFGDKPQATQRGQPQPKLINRRQQRRFNAKAQGRSAASRNQNAESELRIGH